ncbi:MAG: FxLYD domain-containing protein [Candidatus Altiarchaeota archaeon]|nr:FxLYD domain-containing protein [Candidatus Altiarchaeota archaeon]
MRHTLLLVALALVLVSGCVKTQDEPSTDSAAPSSTTSSTSSPTTSSTSSSLTSSTTQSTTSTMESTSSTSTSSTIPEFDYGTLKVLVGGCDGDNRGNALVAGYVVNTGNTTSPEFNVVAYLLDDNGDFIDGGLKSARMPGLSPGGNARFLVSYGNVSKWEKCDAEIESA